MDLSVVIDPSDDHVGPGAAVVLGETEPDVAEGLHLDLECNVPLAGRPQHQEIVVEDGAMFPLDAHDAADEEVEEKRADRGLHLSRAMPLKTSENKSEAYLRRLSRLRMNNLRYLET